MLSHRTPLTLILAAHLAFAGAVAADQPAPVAPSDLVRRTVDHELAAATSDDRVMFLNRKETIHGSQTKLMVETHDAMAGLLVAINGRPLSQQERQDEENRLRNLVQNPEEMRKKQGQEKEDEARIRRIIKALPDAFLYEQDGFESGRPGLGRAGEELVRLRMRPNPQYNPPSRVEQVLTGMQGSVLIDPRDNRIARIDVTLFKDVGFGWGILGHLDRGGRFLVEQGEVIAGHWDITRMDLAFTGRVLLFKGLNIKQSEVSSDFRRVPPTLTFAQGVDLLKKQDAEMIAAEAAENNKSH